MSLRDYLRAHGQGTLPPWLARHRPGMPFDREGFLQSRLVFYPGSGVDGHPVAVFGSTRSAHCFVYADYGVDSVEIKKALDSAGRRFAGYRTLDRIEMRLQDLTPRGWRPHVVPRDYPFATQPPYGFVEILERQEDKNDTHGPDRIAVLFLGADGNATYDALFCQSNGTPPPIAVLIHDHGFGGNYPDGRFGGGGLLESIAELSGVFPQWLLVAETSRPWSGFSIVPGIDGDPGGVHATPRFLYERQVGTR
jgi:hypothetical protein